MGFGRPRARRLESPAGPATILRHARVARYAFIPLFAWLCLCSCAPSGKAKESNFSAALGSIDSLLASGGDLGAGGARDLDRFFGAACRSASSEVEWLSVLKRARAAEAIEKGLLARTASVARKSRPSSEAVASVLAYALVREGRASESLAVCAEVPPGEIRGIWAEAFVDSRKEGSKATPADYGRLAEVAGDPRAYLGAAASALEDEDTASARSWLDRGLANGAQAPPELLWDCALYRELASSSDVIANAAGSAIADPQKLALLGDAAWMCGESSLAERRWERSIAQAPRRSWKPYAELALAFESIPGGAESAASYWSRLKSAFLSGPPSAQRDGALAAYAAELSREGREKEALSALAGGGSGAPIKLLTVTIQDSSQSEERLVADLERLAAESSDDPAVVGAVLRALFVRGKYGELDILRQEAKKRDLGLELGWYYDAALATARGDLAGAQGIIERKLGGADKESPAFAAGAAAEGDFALGSLQAAQGEAVKAAETLARAASEARGAHARCEALKALGRALGDSGEAAAAASAFRSAVAADPADPEAAVLARDASARR
jgi:tetratricopeptide (TPR) repeat protein